MIILNKIKKLIMKNNIKHIKNETIDLNLLSSV
jgi:hypothetical protein